MRASILALAPLLLFPTFAQAGGGIGVGDSAPALTVSSWVKGDAVTSYTKGHTYVVEFWATWCGPCKVSIPHLSELQKKYADQVTMIGVSVWEDDPKLVAPFVENMGDKMAYAVAMDELKDEEGMMATGWMKAAGQKGIPAAFIVNGEGRIAWIGHPMEMDGPLEKIVAGTWDIEAAAKEFRAEQERAERYDVANKKLRAAQKAGQWEAVVTAADAIIAIDAGYEMRVGPTKFAALLELAAWERAYGYAATLVDGPAKEEAGLLNHIAWMIVDPKDDFAKRDLDLALRAAERANGLTEGADAAVLDTLGLVLYTRGEIERAIEIQEKAVKLSTGEMQAELKQRLETFREALETQGV